MNLDWLVLFIPVLAQLVVFLRWLHRRMRDAEIERAFVKDMATNHLPHTYHALRLIAEKLDVEIGDPPPIRFLSINGNNGSH